ncbi:MAG TPA: peptide-methionine (S)-S-oxide reductase MsrA, partial [Polyangiaceae bacterium]
MLRTLRRLSLALPMLFAACHSSASVAADTSTSGHTAAAPLSTVGTDPGHAGAGTPLQPAKGDELAAFAEGCFWGSEDTFRHVPGVVATAVGYSGGHTTNPSYEDVCSHTTGHAETVLVEFDPAKVTYADLLRTFWESHDPTTLNRQGPDVGDQYRSSIFTFSAQQDAAARASMAEEQKHYDRKITTDVRPIGPFWKAEG